MNKDRRGFTIIEFLIATAIFSLVLLLLATAIIFVGRVYHKGIVTNKTQDIARSLVDDIADTIRFGERTSTSASFFRTDTKVLSGQTVNALCLGSVRYVYTLERSLGLESSQSRHVVWRDIVGQNTSCDAIDLMLAEPSSGMSGKEMMSDNVRLAKLSICYGGQTGCDNVIGQWGISLVVSYGRDNDVFAGGSDYTECVNSNLGGQFCAVSKIETKIFKRLE